MELSCMMLAAYAEVAADGKISMLGGDLDTINVPNLPVTSAIPFYLVVKVRFQPDECGRQYAIRIELLNPNGEVIVQTENQANPPLDPNSRGTKVALVIILGTLTLTLAGEHSFRLLIDGAEVRRSPLYIDVQPAR